MNPDSLIQMWPTLVAAALTVCVFSYLLGDNPFYRIAVHMFVGVAAAYAVIVAIDSVIIPRGEIVIQSAFGLPGSAPDFALLAAPWVMGAFMLLKISRRYAPLGNFAVAFLIGVGAALTIGGAITGTIFSQVQASWDAPEPGLGGLFKLALALFSTALVLLYFLYTGRSLPDGAGERFRFLLPFTWAGEGLLTVGLAGLFAGALAAAFALFIERIEFLIKTGAALLVAAGFLPPSP